MAPAHTAVHWKIANLVWVATALLHIEHPDRTDFTVAEIAAQAARILPNPPAGLKPHIYLHCVANRAPNPNRVRMLYATGRNTRRLYRDGDPFDPARAGSRTKPDREELATEFERLIHWYDREYSGRAIPAATTDPLLALRGAGRHLAGDEHPDAYVRRLREGWP